MYCAKLSVATIPSETPIKLPIPADDRGPQCNATITGFIQICPPYGISISSAVRAQLTRDVCALDAALTTVNQHTHTYIHTHTHTHTPV